MTAVTLAVIAVWMLLCGSAYVSRFAARRSRRASVGITALFYIVLAAAVLGWFGLTATGFLAISGMVVPFAAALALAMAPRRRHGSTDPHAGR